MGTFRKRVYWFHRQKFLQLFIQLSECILILQLPKIFIFFHISLAFSIFWPLFFYYLSRVFSLSYLLHYLPSFLLSHRRCLALTFKCYNCAIRAKFIFWVGTESHRTLSTIGHFPCVWCVFPHRPQGFNCISWDADNNIALYWTVSDSPFIIHTIFGIWYMVCDAANECDDNYKTWHTLWPTGISEWELRLIAVE